MAQHRAAIDWEASGDFADNTYSRAIAGISTAGRCFIANSLSTEIVVAKG